MPGSASIINTRLAMIRDPGGQPLHRLLRGRPSFDPVEIKPLIVLKLGGLMEDGELSDDRMPIALASRRVRLNVMLVPQRLKRFALGRQLVEQGADIIVSAEARRVRPQDP